MKYIHMLPFLDEEDLDELVENIKSGEVKDIKMVVLYPFLSRKSLESLVDYFIKENYSKELSRALPFISREKVNEIYDSIENGTVTGINELSILPFLGKKKIKEMFHKSIKEAAKNKETFDDEDEE
ncbi:MAG: hypothetical protein KQ78_01202 [Candidatus Izimaplasma bacterium HR2]|nr:MAG: hypothetical protein KQ78_01202 [Candidatus Izimaplasma bacterium HR2]